MYTLQSLAVAISATFVLVAILQLSTDTTLLSTALKIGTIIFSALSSVASLGSTISVEKEWTKQLCQNDLKQLARLNAGQHCQA